MKRTSVDNNRVLLHSGKPKFNSFMVPKSQFLHGSAENDTPRESSYVTGMKCVAAAPTLEPFSSYKSHLTFNSSANVFSREEVAAIFEELSTDGVIELTKLKAYLFEIGEKEE